MKEVTKTVYVSDDGTEFEYPADCARYEERKRISEVLFRHPDLEWFSDSPCTEDVAGVLLDNFLMVPMDVAQAAAAHLNLARNYHTGGSSSTWVEITEAMKKLGLPT